MTPLPLLAIPGLMNDERVWKHQQEALAPDREVCIADITAYGSVHEMASAALASAPGPRFALAGFSLGGYVALEMLRQAPDRIAALALVDTGARADTPESTDMRRRMVAAVGAAPANFGAVTAAFLPRVIHPSRAHDDELIDLFTDMARAVGVEGFVRQQQAAMLRIDSRPTLPDIRCPVLVMCGREDLTTPLALSEEMAAMIPGAQLVVIETCGHMAPLERPDEVTQAMVDWLGRAQ
ncbi:pimeloyl-ACP methyl ester carboxylesterase [Variovorax sp. GrIS 2.14]|uniref:alpha/beta fold hydrolase n=1 Tax=Variovorax sp. GrIS 2.14 TaxID=3071709 RepID=UPI0038F6C4C0